MAKPKPTKVLIPAGVRRKSADGYYAGWFYDEVFGHLVHLIWPLRGKRLTGEQLAGYLERTFGIEYHNIGDRDGGCTEVVSLTGLKGAHVISLWNPWEGLPRHLDILAHEAFHCADQILADVRVPLVSGTDNETFAYLIGSIVRRCAQMLNGTPQ